jgi:DNA-binding NarL/FixJ family response regulator
MIRLLIVDDHQLMRDGLVRLLSLEPDIELIGTACDGAEAVKMVAEHQPNLVLMDIRMPEMSGIQATREIKTRYPDVKVVLLTMHDEDDYIFEGISAGASGYLLKDSSRDELISSIHRVQEGQVEMTPSVTSKIVKEFASLHQGKRERPNAAAAPDELSRREMDVLNLVVRGCSNRQIAQQLYIDETTVKTHLHRIFEKLNVRDRTQAAILAMQKGWCQPAGTQQFTRQ